MSSIRKFTSFIFLLIIISCGKTKTEMNDIEIIFDNELMIFNKNSKPYTGSIVEYHNNNRVKIEMKVLNGLKNGNIKQFYASGKKQTHSNFKNGKLFAYDKPLNIINKNILEDVFELTFNVDIIDNKINVNYI